MPQKNYVSVNSLSTTDREKLRKVINEMNDSMTRADSEKEFQKEAVDTICEELGLDKKLVRRMAKTYYKATFNDEVDDNNKFEDFYSVVMNIEKT